MEPTNMGGCVSYLLDKPMINIGGHYDVRLCRYNPWGKYIMALIQFD